MSLSGIVVLLFFLTLIISFLGSISGVGGGVLYIPLLMLFLSPSNSNDEIKLISTFLVFASALFNVILESIKKNINPLIVLVSIIFSTPSIFLGNWFNDLANQANKGWIMQIIIIVFLSIVSVLLILTEYVFSKKQKETKKTLQRKSLLHIKISKSNPKKISIITISIIAFFSGLITSLTGMGGGPIIMPILIMFCYLNMRESAPISHTIIMISSFITLVLYGIDGVFTKEITLNFLMPLSIAAIGSTIASFYLKKYIKKEVYIKWVLIILIWASIIKMIIDVTQQI